MKLNIAKATACAALVATMTSCGKIDDLVQFSSNIQMPLSTGTCPDAKYLNEARAWDINAEGTPYEGVGRIELTASGNFMFLPKMDDIQFEDIDNIDDEMDYVKQRSNMRAPGREAASQKHSSPFARRSQAASTRSYDQFPVGTFTKTGENEYTLSPVGKLIVNSNGTISFNDGQGEYNFDATPLTGYELNELTRRFSRTWEIAQVERAYYDSNGKIVKKRILSQEEVEDYYVRAVVVSQYGTFIQYEWDRTFEDYGAWRWEIPEKQVFQYAFREYDPYSYNQWNDYGYEQVFFYDDFAMYLEYGETDDEGTYYDTVDVLKTRATNDFNF